MTFKEWLFKHLKESTPIGDLARDARDDIWGGDTVESLENRMQIAGASVEALEALQEAKAEYQRAAA